MVVSGKNISAQDLIYYMEQIAPPKLAEAWDNSGWQVGYPANCVQKVLLTLDITPAVVKEAIKKNVQLIVSHHPLLFNSVKSIRFDDPTGNMIISLIKANIGLYSAHTTLDSALGGVSDVLTDLLKLTACQVLEPVRQEQLLKLVVFVPQTHAEAMRQALGGAGAGHIGAYSHCTYNLQGTGTFLPLPGTNPFIGKINQLEQVEETRIETIITGDKISQVLEKMIAVHPYEEVAYDLYPLANSYATQGLGRIGQVFPELTLIQLARQVKKALVADNLRYGGDPEKIIRRVAVCGGSGGDLWQTAKQKGADVFITGDIRHHTALDMVAAGLSFIDAGHFITERVVLPILKERLNTVLAQDGVTVDIELANSDVEPWLNL